MKKSEKTFHRIAAMTLFVLMAITIVGCNDSNNKPTPSITATDPADGAADVRTDADITATFNVPVDESTINSDSFTVGADGEASVTGSVSVSDNGETVTFTAASNLVASTEYTATIGETVESQRGRMVDGDHTWTFTTSDAEGNIDPTVKSTTPIDGAAGVPTNADITATFNVLIDAATIDSNTFTVGADGEASITGSVSVSGDGNIATFTGNSNLGTSTDYTATISDTVDSQTGLAMNADYTWTFTTGDTADNTAPTIDSTDPADGDLEVPTNRSVSVVFNETMHPATFDDTSFTLNDANADPVTATVSYLGTTATLNPDDLLQTGSEYTASVSTDVTDLAGNSLASAMTWAFTTGESEAKGPKPVFLGTAGNYAILAKSAISTTGTTSIVGDLGLSPAAESFITGFSLTRDSSDEFSTSPLVNGRIYAADMASPTPSKLTTAIGDMEIAYNDAAGRTTPDETELGAGDISGMTLDPGLYNWSTGLLIASDITLSGGPDDVWILQIAQDLTVESGVSITLAGGALPKNVFWQVSGSTSFGTTAEFSGILLCKTQIAVNTDAVINGRALSQTAVTLDANAVTEPAD